MIIGIDVSALQGPHRYRGIGKVVHSILSNLPNKSNVEYVLYGYEDGSPSLQEISALLASDLKHELRPLSHLRQKEVTSRQSRPMRYIKKAFQNLKELNSYRTGDARVEDTQGIDAFLQLDQSMPLPKLSQNKACNVFVAYDIIPYVLESDYLWSYETARSKGLNRRASFKCSVRRSLYINKLRINARRADLILAISQTTKSDYIRHVTEKSKKIKVIPLGVDEQVEISAAPSNGSLSRYKQTSWGYLPHSYSLKDKRFLLFVGGADSRRKLDELVTAFNHLRAIGKDYKLVLTGDSMRGPLAIPDLSIQDSLATSSYLEDIVFAGFVDEPTKEWLYSHAAAFLFPSVYEGFGLPVLEAMRAGTPVICYPSDAVREVAGDYPLYAKNALEIVDQITYLESLSKKDTLSLIGSAKGQSSMYTWKRAAKTTIDLVASRRNSRDE